MIVEVVHGLMKVGSDHSMDSCPISTQGNSADTDLICEAMERSNPWTNKHIWGEIVGEQTNFMFIYSLWHKWASLLYVATLHFNLCTYKKYAQSSRPKVTRKWEKSTLKISGDSRITQQKISFSFKINPRPIQIALSIFFWKGIFYKCTFLHLHRK